MRLLFYILLLAGVGIEKILAYDFHARCLTTTLRDSSVS